MARTNIKTGRNLIKKISPLLSTTPIKGADIQMDVHDVVILTVHFTVTDDILKALNGEDFSHLLPDQMDGI